MTVPSGWLFMTHGRGIINRCAGSSGHRLTVRKRVSCQSGDTLAKSYIVRTRNIHRSCRGGSSIEHMHCYDRHGENNREGEMERESNEKVEYFICWTVTTKCKFHVGSTKEMDEVKNFVEENEHKDKSIKQYASDRQITGHPTNFFSPSPPRNHPK